VRPYHDPSCSRASGSGGRGHSSCRHVAARQRRGHRRPGSGAPVAIRRAERRGDRERYAFNAAPSGMMPCTA
jgi:hypothetical protein